MFKLFQAGLKVDARTSSVNALGMNDWDSIWRGFQEAVTKLFDDKDAGVAALHIYWDLGDASYWVSTLTMRREVNDPNVAYEGCDTFSTWTGAKEKISSVSFFQFVLLRYSWVPSMWLSSASGNTKIRL